MRYPQRERRRIRSLRRHHPELSELLDLLAVAADLGEAEAGFEAGQVPAPLAGFPPLFPADFPLDDAAAAVAFRSLLETLAAATGNETAEAIRTALEAGRLDARPLVEAYIAADGPRFESAARGLEGVDPDLLVALAELAVKPQFVAAARALEAAGRIREPGPGERQDRCPACGSVPEIGLIIDRPRAERQLMAVCRLCETEWPVPRLRCLGCGNENEETLTYLGAEGEEGARVNVCESCHAYLPVLDTRGRLEVAPAVERAGLAYLDVVARERGYRPLTSILARTTGRTTN
jgi:FdhE protein